MKVTFSRGTPLLLQFKNITNPLYSNFHRTRIYLNGIHTILFLCAKDHKSLFHPPKEQMSITYLDHLTGTNDVNLSLKNKLNKHLETFNNVNYEREQTVTAPLGPFQSAEQIFI